MCLVDFFDLLADDRLLQITIPLALILTHCASIDISQFSSVRSLCAKLRLAYGLLDIEFADEER